MRHLPSGTGVTQRALRPRAAWNPAGIEAIVRGHGHVDHATGLPSPTQRLITLASRAVIGGVPSDRAARRRSPSPPRGQLATDVIVPAVGWKATHPIPLPGAFMHNGSGLAVWPPP